jgi:LPXTG-site transpeptidase (sortase) family protein
MIRFSKYHLLAALGLILAYNSVLGILDSIRPSLPPSPEGGVIIAPTAVQLPTLVDADPPEIDPPPEMITHSSRSISPAIISLPAPATATPAARAIIPPSEAAPETNPAAQALSEEPIHLFIPAIDLDAPVVPAKIRTIKFRGEKFQQWLAPNYYAVGWHTDSARLGAIGNTVLSGHHNVLGAVFSRLVDLQAGDVIQVYSHDHLFVYQVTNRMIVPEKYQQMDTRMANLQWILPSQDERLTLITCWPNDSNTHRVIIVAAPVRRLYLDSGPD